MIPKVDFTDVTTDSLEVVVIREVDMEVDEEADNGMDKELDMDMGHK